MYYAQVSILSANSYIFAQAASLPPPANTRHDTRLQSATTSSLSPKPCSPQVARPTPPGVRSDTLHRSPPATLSMPLLSIYCRSHRRPSVRRWPGRQSISDRIRMFSNDPSNSWSWLLMMWFNRAPAAQAVTLVGNIFLVIFAYVIVRLYHPPEADTHSYFCQVHYGTCSSHPVLTALILTHSNRPWRTPPPVP